MPELSAFAGKRVLITGNTGFKGSWLTVWLHRLGARVVGYSLDDHGSRELQTLPCLEQIFGDIRDFDRLRDVFQEYSPEIVFHLAAQPLVMEGYEHPRYTIDVNVVGTLNVLECIRQTPECRIGVLVTSDKCYDNKDWIWSYREVDPLGGHDPYSSSKACCEILIAAYRDSFFNPTDYPQHRKSIASVRAGNVIGGGDWSKNRIIPDCIRQLRERSPIEVRNPGAIRPWQHVVEPLAGYVLLGSRLMREPTAFSGAWNFGPEGDNHISVRTLVEKVISIWGDGSWTAASPDGSTVIEPSILRLDISKAKYQLGWLPRLDIDRALAWTVAWYQAYDGTNKVELCLKQIEAYTQMGHA